MVHPKLLISLSTGGLLKLWAWADDSATFFIDGVAQPPLGTTAQVGPCSNQIIGCVLKDGGYFEQNLAAGTHTISFDVFQTGPGGDTTSNPTGLLYSGTVPDGGTTLMLLGCAFFGIETLRRKIWS